MYLLLGCGDVCFTLANKMKEKDEEIKLIEKDPKKADQLEAIGFDVFQGDFTEPKVIREAGAEQAEIIFILCSDSETTERAMGAINQVKLDMEIDPLVVVRVTDSLEVDGAKKHGAAEVLPSSEIFADFTYQKFREFKERIKEKHMRKVLEEVEGKMAIILQDSPDPDSIASGLALQHYSSSLGIDSDLIYGGEIGHQQNRAMVNALKLGLLKADQVNLGEYDAHALVDVATRGNCALPEDIIPTIVLDHHSAISEEVEARHKDIVEVGAAATILTNYLRFGEVEISEPLATALTFAILTDTMNFTRGATHLDFATFEYLLPLVSSDLLRKLQSPPISADTFETIRKAIRSSRVKEGYLISNVGGIKDRDTIPQAADYLLRREGVLTSLVYGIVDDEVHISGRTKDVRLHIGKLMKDIFNDIGSAGGHHTAGGATIPLDAFDVDKDNKKALRGAIDRAVGRKFWETVGALKSER